MSLRVTKRLALMETGLFDLPQFLTYFRKAKKILMVNSSLCPFSQNEEVLKSCAQDYLTRIKKEEQRYQTLKTHAEEKIGQ